MIKEKLVTFSEPVPEDIYDLEASAEVRRALAEEFARSVKNPHLTYGDVMAIVEILDERANAVLSKQEAKR